MNEWVWSFDRTWTFRIKTWNCLAVWFSRKLDRRDLCDPFQVNYFKTTQSIIMQREIKLRFASLLLTQTSYELHRFHTVHSISVQDVFTCDNIIMHFYWFVHSNTFEFVHIKHKCAIIFKDNVIKLKQFSASCKISKCFDVENLRSFNMCVCKKC